MTLRVDVVIPTWNKRELVLNALATLAFQTEEHTVYVVDNASDDGTVASIHAAFPHVVVLSLPENRGFAKAVNAGISAGSNEFIVTLNNDVEAAPDFLEHMVAAFLDAAVGAVAGVLLTADGESVDAAGVTIDRSLAGYSHLHGASLTELAGAAPAMVPCGGAAAFRREVFERVGAFDEEIFAYSEDVELGLRLLAAGELITTAWDARVRHLGSATLGHRSEAQLRLSAWSRGYVLGRYRVGAPLVVMELAIGLLDASTVRTWLPLTRRLAGLRHGRGLSPRPIPKAVYVSIRHGLAPRWAAFTRRPQHVPGPRVGVENGHKSDPVSWLAAYTAGSRPDATPYGMNRLAEHGVNVTILGADRSPNRLSNLLAASVLRLARVDPIGVLRSRGLDVLLTEHEKLSIPALLASPLRPGLKVVTGVVWLTDVDVDVDVQALRVLKWALRRAAGIFVHSSAQLPVLESWGIAAEKLFLAPFGVDVDFWQPTEATEVKAGLIVSAGSDRDRDYSSLLRAFDRIQRRRRDVWLEIAGVPIVREQPRVSYLGTLSHAALRDRYRRASVVAVPTRPNVHCSGLTSTLESMACGRPVVVNANPGMADYVEDGVTGRLVPPGDDTAMAKAIQELMDEPEEAEAMGLRARAKAAEYFSTDRFAAVLADICRQVIASH